MTDPKFDEPPDSGYWDTVGMMNGKRVLGHLMTDEELETFNRTIYCGQNKWTHSDGIIWRYELK